MRYEFDLDPNLIYLNSGTHSICPREVQEAVTRYQREFERNPTWGLYQVWPKIWQIQTELGDFFNAGPDDLFLRSSVTAVLNAFILGIPLQSGSEILTTDLEYGAVANICRFRSEQDDLKLRALHLPMAAHELVGLTTETLVEQVVSQIRPETRMLVLSHVITGNGLVLPIAEIARHTRKAGVFLVVDAAHAPGAVKLDFKELEDVDFYGGNLHKWMMGPKGTSFGWVPRRNQELLRPIIAGWTTFETGEYYQNFGEGSRFQGKMLTSGCQDFAPFFALHETLNFWRRLKPENIMKRIYELQACAEEEFHSKLGWPLLSPAAGKLRGPLVSFELPPNLKKVGFQLMFDAYHEHKLQIAIAPIGGADWCLRLTPHIYNTESEIVKAAKILKDFGN